MKHETFDQGAKAGTAPEAAAAGTTVAHEPVSLFMRAFWYGVAGIVTIALNPALFALFHDFLGWNNYAAYALSLALVNVLQFLWSYHIGFRTHEHWTVSAKRQGATLVAANVLNYALVVMLQASFPDWKKTVIVGVQVLVAALKFLVYHYWVYPHRAPDEGPDTGSPLGQK